ncbi:cache domain-containing protein [Rhodoferax sp.]|uniref:cache domain-containing protein n=1 Tax=Rhodoferax sp. TaxID=50421 RepID=UPI002717CBDF|nr:cache domain-containing protein [Rhodoferax sp.]MDO8449767.1 cache domain-containing protein [Rhodoferax sp.]MDO9195542.1 cache domain-containing protein [Rhodoferax sp.]
MKLFRTLMTLLFAGVMSVSAMAQDHGTKDEAKVMANAALAHIKKVGNDQAFKDFTSDKANWTKKDLYVFSMEMKGVVLAHGANEKLVGKNLIELKDQNGKAFAREFIDVGSTKGEGWVDYDWAHPVTKKVEGKTSYVKRIPGFDGFVVVGVYR